MFKNAVRIVGLGAPCVILSPGTDDVVVVVGTVVVVELQ